MESIKCILKCIVIAGICVTYGPKARAAELFALPKDLPTAEALMDLHKTIKKDEDAALTRIATSFGEQSIVTKGAIKFNEVRSTLDSKLNNAYSYLVLASAISGTSISLYKLINEYSDFTTHTFRNVQKKPFVAWYYADANVAIAREVNHIRKLYLSMAASGINLMKASMDEKLDLIFTLKNSIEKVRSLVYKANLYCFLVADCNWKPDYIWEIKNSNIRDEIATQIANKWNKKINI